MNCKMCKVSIRKKAGKHVKGCFFNGILTFIDGTLVVILIMSLINIKLNIKDQIIEKDASYYLAVIGLLACSLEIVLFPLFVCSRYR